jgi:hypothetical protein
MIRRPRAALAALLSVLLGSTLTIGLLAGPAGAASPFPPKTIKVPFDSDIFIPCNGDTVTATGTLNLVFTTSQSQNVVTLVSHTNPQGVSGTDTEGRAYHGVGVSQTVDHIVLTSTAFTITEHDVSVFDFIGSGRAPNLKLTTNLRITVVFTDPNLPPNITVKFDKETATCR